MMSPVMQPTRAPSSTGPDQFLYMNFGPRAPEDLIKQWEWDILHVLEAITKIDYSNWQYSGGMDQMSPSGEQSFEVAWKIWNNHQSKAKMLALKKMLDYDLGEQFKTLFNTLIEQYNGDLYIVSVHEGSLSGIQKQAGVLGQHSGLSDADEVLGHGVLYALDESGTGQMFCNNMVCTLYWKLIIF